MPATTRVLVVANSTADSDELHAALLERAGQGPVAITLLAPATWDVTDPGGRDSALRRLNRAAIRLRQAGIEIERIVGDPDPVTAVAAIWDPQRFDEVIVATLPEHLSRWLRLGLPHRVERLTGRPVCHVVAQG